MRNHDEADWKPATAGWKPALRISRRDEKSGTGAAYSRTLRDVREEKLLLMPFVERAMRAKDFSVRASVAELLLRPRDFVSAGRLLKVKRPGHMSAPGLVA